MRALLLTVLCMAAQAAAQEPSLFGVKKAPAQDAAAPSSGVIGVSPSVNVPEDPNDSSVVISPFRPQKRPEAKETRVFSIAKLNRPLAYETNKELQRLFSAFIQQHVQDAAGEELIPAPGPITTIEYVVQQDLGEGRLLVKANWIASGDGLLPAASEAYAVLMPEKPKAVGDKGQCVVTGVGMVSVRFTPTFAPLAGRRLTLRREAFIECSLIPESVASQQKFVDLVKSGAELSVITAEKFPCKACGGLGFTREAQKGKLDDKRIPCAACESGKVTVRIETKFTP